MSKDDFPVVDRSGQVMQHAGKYARNAVLTVFQQMGGTDAMTKWAKENPTDFYTKMFSKVIDKEPPAMRESSVEELLQELDREMIDVTPDQVEEVEAPAHRSPWPAADEYYEDYTDD